MSTSGVLRRWSTSCDVEGIAYGAIARTSTLPRTDHFVIFLTPASAESPQVARELDVALAQRKNVVPVLSETCPLPESVRHLNCIDWRAVDDYRQHMMGRGFADLRAAVLFSPTGMLSALETDLPQEEERAIATRREQDARRAESVRQVVVVRDGGEVLAEIRLRQRFKWRENQPFTIAGASYRVVRAVEHSTAAVDVEVARVRSSPLAADSSG